MRFRLLALAACLGLATLAGAAAQDRAGTFEVSPFAGGYFGGRLYGNTTVSTAPGTTTTLSFLEPDDDLAYGVRLAYNVSRIFAFEFDWTSARTDLRAPSLSGASSRNPVVVGRLRQNVYEANTLFNFGKRRAVGYFGLGAGVATLDRTDATVDPQSLTRFTANISAGAKFFFTPRVGLRLDGRYRVIDRSSGDGGSCDRGGFCSDRWNHWSYNGELTGGLVLAF